MLLIHPNKSGETMHVLGATQFLVTLAISAASTFLVSRILFLLLRRQAMGIRKVAVVNGASFVICYVLLVIWCSTSAKIYWFAGHVAFAPQALLYIYDLLHWSDEDVEADDVAEFDS
jgi:hypothetical protein